MDDHTTNTPLKQCTKCHEWKPATTAHFKKKKTGKYGVASWCKPCTRDYNRELMKDPARIEKRREQTSLPEYRQKARDRQQRAEAKARRKERESTPEFLEKQRERMRVRRNMATPEQKARASAKAKEYQQRPDVVARRKARQQDPEYRQFRTAQIVAWAKKPENRERINARRREMQRTPEQQQKDREWRQSDNGRLCFRIAAERRRARKINLLDDFSAEQWIYSRKYFNGCCAVCGRQLDDLFGEHRASADHWIPLSSPDCIGTTRKNMIPLCHGKDGCNNSKGASDPVEWLNRKFGNRRAREILKRIQAYFDSLE